MKIRYLVLVLVSTALIMGSCSRDDKGEVKAPASTVDLGEGGVILLTQAQFITGPGGNPIPGPARLELIRSINGELRRTILEDSVSNVFHKAMITQMGEDIGVLTIGANNAALTFWKVAGELTAPERLWQPVFGGKHNRLRDIEIADVDGDGVSEMILATHDQGVVAVCSEKNGDLEVTRVDSQPKTFVHEIEVGDLNGNGINEVYATPSQPNRASGGSQPGKVVQYEWDGQRYVRRVVADFENTHAKEILVADLDLDGTDELYVVKEAVVSSGGLREEMGSPVTILRYSWSESGWKTEQVTTLPDRQCRFLIVTDLDGDSKPELVAAGFKSGLWWIKQGLSGDWSRELIDSNSSGFEHACSSADMDGDGKEELYVASDDQKELRRYKYGLGRFDKELLMPLVGDVITWGLTVGRL